jgi:hypothetical protein
MIKSPDEFVQYYSSAMQEYFGKYDIQVNKLGFIGFLLNILAQTHFDSKQYYDKLFRESFIGTSRNEYNLRLHGSIYQYFPEFANYSTASGSFIFDFNQLPIRPPDIIKRKVTFENITFNVDGNIFTTESKYVFVDDEGYYYCLIYTNDNNDVIMVPSSSPIIEVGFNNVRQIETRLFEVAIQDYEYSTFYPTSIKIKENEHLSNITVRVGNEYEQFDPEDKFENFGTIFNVKTNKYLSMAQDKDCFLTVSDNYEEIIVEFGSGIRGKYIPNRYAVIKVDLTNGEKGNISIPYTPSVENSSYSMTNHFIDGRVLSGAISSDYLKINFEYSEGGKNPLSSDQLRKGLIDYIQTRDNFIGEQDYYNIAKKYIPDFKFTFRKGHPLLNTFYLERCFRDKYQNIAITTNLTRQMIKKPSMNDNIDEMKFIISNSQEEENFVDSSGNFYVTCINTNQIVNERFVVRGSMFLDSGVSEFFISKGEPTYGGNLPSGTYKYFITATDNFNEFIIGKEFQVSIDGIIENAVKLTWDSVPGVVKYIVYARPDRNGHYRKWEVYKNEFIDVGDEGTPYIPITSVKQLIFYPEFEYYGKVFLSPFVYEYDDHYHWYKGYILYSDFMVYFTNVSEISKTEKFPIIFLNIVYNKIDHITTIYIKSFQDISKYDFYISLRGTNILNQKIVSKIDNNTWSFKAYGLDYGLLWGEISAEVTAYNKNSGAKLIVARTNTFQQIYDISDQLKLFKYHDVVNDIDFLTNIPVIDKDLFYSDHKYYTDKVYEFLYDINFKENRQITNEIQFRFLNTYVIPKYYLEKLTKQKYNGFDLKFPLKLNCECYIHDNISDDINLNNEKNKIIEELGKYLNENATGSEIKIYQSQIEDLIHNFGNYIKSVRVSFYDSEENELKDGLETINNKELFNLINSDLTKNENERKINILKFTSPFFFWDINNIDFKFKFI